MSRWWGLTTVSQHAHEQGVRAAEAMIKAVSGDGNGSDKDPPSDLKVELMVRDTTGPPAPDISL
jgi:DNA-binding LacI/PurR family transcriptional regulator